MEESLILKSDYVYNKSNEWLSCTVISGEIIHFIKRIPPRSCRYFPSTFINPSIVKIQKIEISNSIDKNNNSLEDMTFILFNSNITSVFEGTFEIPGSNTSITSTISINDKNIIGWFMMNLCIYMIKGFIQENSNKISLDIFPSGGQMIRGLVGKIHSNNGKICIDAALGNIILQLITIEDLIEPQKDLMLSGSYLALIVKDFNEKELSLILNANNVGIIHAKAFDNRKEISLIGVRNPNDFNLFFISENDNITLYNGEISTNFEYINGHWSNLHHSGTFIFSKSK